MSGTVDWTVLEIEGVDKVARQVARNIANEYRGTIERADTEQEALIILATKADEMRNQLSLGGHRFLYVALKRDLIDSIKTEHKNRAQHVSRDAWAERLGAA